MDDYKAVFDKSDMNGSKSINFEEFNNLLVSVLNMANIAQDENGHWQGIYPVGELQDLISGNASTFSPEIPGQLNFPEFYNLFKGWVDHIISLSFSEKNQYALTNGTYITKEDLTTKIIHDILPGLVTGKYHINPISQSNTNANTDTNANVNTNPLAALTPMHRIRMLENAKKSININETGYDIMGATENKNIQEFILETMNEGETPIIMKVLNANSTTGSHYLLTYKNLGKMAGNRNFNKLTVFPCYEANGKATRTTRSRAD